MTCTKIVCKNYNHHSVHKKILLSLPLQLSLSSLLPCTGKLTLKNLFLKGYQATAIAVGNVKGDSF